MPTPTELIANLADAMLGNNSDNADGSIDMLAIYAALRPLLSGPDYTALGHALELCPMHGCDYRICADDGVEACAEVRGD